jgi:hypothetical protein
VLRQVPIEGIGPVARLMASINHSGEWLPQICDATQLQCLPLDRFGASAAHEYDRKSEIARRKLAHQFHPRSIAEGDVDNDARRFACRCRTQKFYG